MGPALGFAFGLFLGIALTAVMSRSWAPKHAGGSINSLTATCDSVTPGMVHVTCSATADPGCTIEGLYAIVYDDPLKVPPDLKEGTEVGIGAGPFNFTMTCSSVNKDKLAVWPIFKGNGPPKSIEIGPCNSGPLPPTPVTTKTASAREQTNA